MIFQINPEETYPDLENWLSIESARSQGFKFLLADDGDADVLAPDGTTYLVNGFRCACKNHVYRNHCFHELWVRQLRPCEMCGCVMEITQQTTCFNHTTTHFECTSCGNARDLDLVKEERKLGTRNPRLTREGRCKQAIAWLSAKQSDWYVWQVVYQSPELIGTMVGALSETGHDILADKIVQEAGYKAA